MSRSHHTEIFSVTQFSLMRFRKNTTSVATTNSKCKFTAGVPRRASALHRRRQRQLGDRKRSRLRLRGLLRPVESPHEPPRRQAPPPRALRAEDQDATRPAADACRRRAGARRVRALAALAHARAVRVEPSRAPQIMWVHDAMLWHRMVCYAVLCAALLCYGAGPVKALGRRLVHLLLRERQPRRRALSVRTASQSQ